MEEERTIASRIAPGEDSVAVTFDAECADKYPSIHHLAPGNPLLAQLVEIFVEECDETKRLDWEACYGRVNLSMIPPDGEGLQPSFDRCRLRMTEYI